LVPAPTDWTNQQIAASVKILDVPVDPNGEARERRLKAGQTLRFLDSPDAAIEWAKRLGSGDDLNSWSLHMGVLGSPYRKQLLPVIEARLIAPEPTTRKDDRWSQARLSRRIAYDDQWRIALPDGWRLKSLHKCSSSENQNAEEQYLDHSVSIRHSDCFPLVGLCASAACEGPLSGHGSS
jgi:hypothetical protein